MSLMHHLRSHVQDVVGDKMESLSVKVKVEQAVSKMKKASLDHYDMVSALSIYWASDDTGAKDDSALWLETIRKLGTEGTVVIAAERVLQDKEDIFGLIQHIVDQARAMGTARRLFILHYAGHGAAENKADKLVITARICESDQVVGPELDMTYIKDSIELLAKRSDGLDALVLLDCCCASTAGRGTEVIGERLELMAATSSRGLSNRRCDGKTFTQSWCDAFEVLLDRGQPFDCTDICNAINCERNLAQFPATFVVREGWGVPITFRAVPHSMTLSSSSSVLPASQFVVTAFHLKEDPNSEDLRVLISYLEGAPVPISVLGALSISSTLLVLRVPQYFQEMLALPRLLVF